MEKENGRLDFDEERYSEKRKVDPYHIRSPFFQAEGGDAFELAHFIDQFDDDEGEFLMREYWMDEKTGFQSQEVGPTTGEYTAGAIIERLDDIQDSGYGVSIYRVESDEGFILTGGLSPEFPRGNLERILNASPQVQHSDGGFTVRGNLNVSGEDLYQKAIEDSELKESRIWPRIDSALSDPLKVRKS